MYSYGEKNSSPLKKYFLLGKGFYSKTGNWYLPEDVANVTYFTGWITGINGLHNINIIIYPLIALNPKPL